MAATKAPDFTVWELVLVQVLSPFCCHIKNVFFQLYLNTETETLDNVMTPYVYIIATSLNY